MPHSHPSHMAAENPNKPAYTMAESGEIITYGMLEKRSNQTAQLFRQMGLKHGDGIALFMLNSPRFLEICWGAQRSGLRFTAISTRLTADEVAYIVGDCGAKSLFVSAGLSETAAALPAKMPKVKRFFSTDGALKGYESYEQVRETLPETPIADQSPGVDMLYSSGTTGRPKGVKRAMPEGAFDDPYPNSGLLSLLYEMDEHSIYLSPAPLYHAAPLVFTMSAQRLGASCVVMEHFDPEASLRFIERYKVSHSQWVPTMFVRMLKMPAEARERHDLSSLRCAIHAAAPCPIEIKRQMIDWWGQIIHEYYAGTEGNGFCVINSEEWLKHPGSVGKAVLGIPHICDEEGNELPVGEEGVIYFESEIVFEYHQSPEKTKESRHPVHGDWTTLGDVGRLDEDGYLYLTDRKSFMIISGGVNIYPQETENILITHPKVQDVAVFGVPNEEFGEEVKAVVEPMDWSEAGEALAEELMAYARERLSPIKCPRSVDFEKVLPRHPTGKLYKRLLRDKYWTGRESRIV